MNIYLKLMIGTIVVPGVLLLAVSYVMAIQANPIPVICFTLFLAYALFLASKINKLP